MCPSEPQSDEEREIRESLRATAPKPSAQHNDNVMAAARKLAAERHGTATGQPMLSRWTPAFGIAATMLLAFAAAWLLRTEPPEQDYQRGQASEALTPEDGAALGRAPTMFRWPAIASEQAAQVKLYNDSAMLLWQSELTTSSTIATDKDLELPTNARYFWVVEPASQNTAKALGPFWFTLE